MPLKYPPTITGALLAASSFVAAELKVRQDSYLPIVVPAEGDESARDLALGMLEEIADAEETLKLLEAAMDECGAVAC